MNRSRSRSPISRVINNNRDKINPINSQVKMAIPITSVEVNIIPKFSGDYRELPLFLEIANNFYTRYANNANVPHNFLLDCIKSRLEGEPLCIIASRRLNTKDAIFNALKEMYSDPRSELTLELDITNFYTRSTDIVSIGNEIRELISYYDTKLSMNVGYDDNIRQVKSNVFKGMALQAFFRSIMIINSKLGEFLLTQGIGNLDQAITVARNQYEWLSNFDKYNKMHKPSLQSKPIQAQKIPPKPNQYWVSAPTNPNWNQISPRTSVSTNPNASQNFYPNFYQTPNPRNTAGHFNANQNFGYQNAYSTPRPINTMPNVQGRSNFSNTQPMEVDPSASGIKVPQYNRNVVTKKPIMGFSNGKRVFNAETSEENEPVTDDCTERELVNNFDQIIEENFQTLASIQEGT